MTWKTHLRKPEWWGGHGLSADPSNLGNLGHQREVGGCRMKISQSVQLPAAGSQMMRTDRQPRRKWIIS